MSGMFFPVHLNMGVYEKEGVYTLVMEYRGFSSVEEATLCGEAQAQAMVMARTGLHVAEDIVH